MYDFIQGTLKASHPTHIVLENNGIGYHIYTPISLFHTMPDLEESLTLYTHFVVREDSMRLFGFLTEAERHLFIMLSDVSGIGPKTALSIIGHMNIDKLGQAVNHADIKALSSIPGIGKITAERLVLEMKDKLGSFASPILEPAWRTNPVFHGLSHNYQSLAKKKTPHPFKRPWKTLHPFKRP